MKVLVAYMSVTGNTKKVAKLFLRRFKKKKKSKNSEMLKISKATMLHSLASRFMDSDHLKT